MEAVFDGREPALHTTGVPVPCYQHMLRHWLGLRMLITLLHAFD